MTLKAVRKKKLALKRKYREAKMFAKALRSSRHPILAHMIPMRRCNLSCAYCNEYDKDSLPVPTEEMLRRAAQMWLDGHPNDDRARQLLSFAPVQTAQPPPPIIPDSGP